MTELITLERDGYGAALGIHNSGCLWAVWFAWKLDYDLGGEGSTKPYSDRGQAICAAVRGLLQSLDEADPLRRNPAVNGVARRRMERIRLWAEDLAAKHRPMAQAVSLFGEGA